MKDRILQELRQTDGFVSGEHLSQICGGVSRTAIWKQIKNLQKEGYQIEAKSSAGYRLVGLADVFNARELAAQIAEGCFACAEKIHCYEEVTSTNTVAKEWAQKAPNRESRHGLVVTAERQTAGKGRLGRAWNSAPGEGIWCSVVLAPEMLLSEASRFSFIAAVAIAEGLSQYTGLAVKIKWPNDLLVQGKKICGILVEMAAEAEHVNHFVLGFGINANQALSDFPEELQAKATSLFLQTGQKVSRLPLLAQILQSLEQTLLLYQKEGFAPIGKRWMDNACFLDEVIIIRQNDKVLASGLMRGIDDDGALLLERQGGEILRILSGDVSMRKNDGSYS